MSDSHKRLVKLLKLAVTITTVSILSLIACAYFIGFRYEKKKFKAFLTTLALTFIYQIFIADVILMLLKATIYAALLRFPWTEDINPIFVGGHDRKEFLKRRITALKSQLDLGPTFYKRNEAMTLKYRDILHDLILFGGYFAILMISIAVTRDPVLYYNSRTIKDVIRNPHSKTSINTILTINDLYAYINGTIIKAFNDVVSYNGKPYPESGWMKFQLAKVLGVVRIRQIRRRRIKDTSNFDTASYGPAWSKKVPKLPYKDKFWRIFKPWQYQHEVQTGGVKRKGNLFNQPAGGYVALLGRNTVNSQRVLTFLHENNWIDRHSAVIIIEVTLYNVDANVFTLVEIFAEQTIFDSFVVEDHIDSLKLLFNIDNLVWYVLVTFLLYLTILMRVVADVVLKMWYSPSMRDYLSGIWNYLDMTIVCLNIFIALGVWLREVYVKHLLQQLQTSKKNEFVPFYRAAQIDEMCTVFVAFLIALTTLRLWKILQFAQVFRVLTNTLFKAKWPLLSTTFFVAIFLTAIGLSSHIINGSNSKSFVGFVKSITTLLSMTFGFGSPVAQSEMNYGGTVVGMILYAVLVVVVIIFLLNMFISVVCLYFAREKEIDIEESDKRDFYTFLHFFESELNESRWINSLKKKIAEGKVLRLRGGGGRLGKPKACDSNANDNLERIELMEELLNTQMELLEENLDIHIEEEDDGDELSVHSNADDCEINIVVDDVNLSSKNVQVPQKTETISRRKKGHTTKIRSV